MFVAIYFNSDVEDMDREEIEDVIKDALMDQEKDLAKVTGGGSGKHGFNVDLEVEGGLGIEEVLRRIRQALQSIEEVGRDTDIAIDDKVFPLYPTST